MVECYKQKIEKLESERSSIKSSLELYENDLNFQEEKKKMRRRRKRLSPAKKKERKKLLLQKDAVCPDRLPKEEASGQ